MRALFFIIFLISFNAQAFLNINCWDGDCLSKGWTSLDSVTNKYVDYQCYREGCKTDGWIVGELFGNESYYTQCKPGGCFQEGWYELSRTNHALLKNIVCESNSCFTKGWMTYISQGVPYKTTCTQYDCTSKGWSYTTAGKYTNVICKKGGCFIEGRTEY